MPEQEPFLIQAVRDAWRKPRPSWRPIVKKILLGLLLIISVALLGLAITAGALYQRYRLPIGTKEQIVSQNDGGVLLLDRNNTPFFSFYAYPNRMTVPLDKVSNAMKQTLVSSEDRDFYKHDGYSIRGIVRSLLTDLEQKKPLAGGSTLTQQLVKISYLTPEKSVERKIRELVMARELEHTFSKNDILEMYLNSAYFGQNAFGVEQAAQTYFGVHANELTTAQSAALVAVLPAPSALSPVSGNHEAWLARYKAVIESQERDHLITAEQAKNLQSDPPAVLASHEDGLNTTGAHFALMVRQQLIDQYGEQTVSHSGFIVRTSLDLDYQKFAESAVSAGVGNLAKDGVTNGAAVVMDPTNGDVLALVGSKDWRNDAYGKVNIATSLRQPGSSFKPYVYALALEQHAITMATILHDIPTAYKVGTQFYQPHDYDNRYRGLVTVRRALSNSLNIPAVEVEQKLQMADIVNTAKAFGLSTLGSPQSYGPALVLGAAEVQLLEHTDGYTAFANGGTRTDPVLIKEIRDKYGQTLITTTPQTHQVISSQTAYLISSILSDTTTRKEVFGHELDTSLPAAVKTGTTSDFKDAWTLGYTPHLTIGVWVGNNDGTPMDRVAGGLGAAPIFKQLLEHGSQNLPHDWYAQPDGLVSARVCTSSGTSFTELFLPGTEPKDSCNLFTLPVIQTADQTP